MGGHGGGLAHRCSGRQWRDSGHRITYPPLLHRHLVSAPALLQTGHSASLDTGFRPSRCRLGREEARRQCFGVAAAASHHALTMPKLRAPLFLTCLAACLLAVVVQSGELGSADTMHRLQTAHSFWTSEPAVFPSEYPEFGIYGRAGKLYDWYGIGQPLLLLPFDIVGIGMAR